jgi:hypothetical protein
LSEDNTTPLNSKNPFATFSPTSTINDEDWLASSDSYENPGPVKKLYPPLKAEPKLRAFAPPKSKEEVE